MNPQKFREFNEEVFYPRLSPLQLGPDDFSDLKKQASGNPRRRARICCHQSPEDVLHEMFIVHAKDCYVRPHKHVDKAESLHVLEGEADVIFFDAEGVITEAFPISASDPGTDNFYRLETGIYHSLIIRSEFLVFHEVTKGPFRADQTVFPEWAPKEGTDAQKRFTDEMNNRLGE